MPERIGRYELLLPIASGGSATVYLARSIGMAGFEREVALKLTHAQLREDPAFAHTLIQEATIAGRIRHPNVVPVLDVDEDPFGVYLVMEYVEGETLSGLAKLADAAGQRVPEPIALRIVSDVLDGLQTAHDLVDTDGAPLGLVHRDVTPHNVLVGVDGIARLTDFGIAKATARIGLTATGRIKGKVAYMSPEQALGKPLDASCDLWAVGVILWELLTGRRLYKSDNDVSTLLKLVSESPPHANSVVRDVPPLLDETVAWALTPYFSPKRCPSALLFAERLKSACVALDELAEPAEVGEWVRRVVGPKLDERHARVAEVRRLRQRMGQLADTTDPSIKTPDSSVLSAGRASVDALLKETDAADDTQALVPTLRAEAASVIDPARSVEQPTDTTSVGGLPRAAAPGKKRQLAVARPPARRCSSSESRRGSRSGGITATRKRRVRASPRPSPARPRALRARARPQRERPRCAGAAAQHSFDPEPTPRLRD